jgi:hypothetical protein
LFASFAEPVVITSKLTLFLIAPEKNALNSTALSISNIMSF